MNEKHLQLLNIIPGQPGAPVCAVDTGFDPRTVPGITPVNFLPGEDVELHGTSGAWMLQQYAKSEGIHCFSRGWSKVDEAARYSAAKGIKVINLSLRDAPLSPAGEAICVANNIIISKSAGNDPDCRPTRPAGVDSCVLTVSAYNPRLNRMDPGNSEGPEVDCTFPCAWDIKLFNGKVVTFGDTSSAAYACSLALSLYVGINPDATIQEMKDFIISNCHPLPGVSREQQGAGLFRWPDAVTPEPPTPEPEPKPPEPPKPPDPEVKPLPRVYLSPSVQEGNFAVDGITEEDRMQALARDVAVLLRTAGIEVFLNDPSWTLAKIVADSNNRKPDLHVALHTNAGGGTGTETWSYKTTGTRSSEFGQLLQGALVDALELTDRGVKDATIKGYRWADAYDTDATAVLAELFFHDNAGDLARFNERREKVVYAIAGAICEWFGLAHPKPPVHSPFKDVPVNHWAFGFVGAVKKAGLMRGFEDGTFRGDQGLTRYEFAKALAIALKLPVEVPGGE